MHPAQGGEYLQPRSGFNIVFRGFDRVEVQRTLADRDREIRQLSGERNSARARADDMARRLEATNSQLRQLSAKLDRLCAAPITAHGLSERLEHMLQLANAEATDIVSKAEAEASDLRASYQRKIAHLEHERKSSAEEHRTLMEGARAEAERIISQAEQRRRQADAEAERRRRQADAEAKNLLRKEQDAAKAETERQTRQATEDAERRVIEAKRTLETLRTRRRQISEQLTSALEKIQESVPMLAALPEEEAAARQRGSDSSEQTRRLVPIRENGK
ncbi:MAG: hypothetical protein ACRDRN_12035 [Sciscionella sp.]